MVNRYKCDAVFEGGGVKGIGFAGAIAKLEEDGYVFENVAGTSAGAIAASLVAAGYTGKEIEYELSRVDFTKFRGRTPLDFLGAGGKILRLALKYGLYKPDYFEDWLSKLLKRKNITVFGDLLNDNSEIKYKFRAIASDLTDHKILILPDDLEYFGIIPENFEVAKAVRMSMSIPFYYEPYKISDLNGKEHLIADGGLLSNYPIWLIDDGKSIPSRPAFGFKFTDDNKGGNIEDIDNIADYSKAIIGTMLEAGDNYHISVSNGDFQRSIMIHTMIKTKNGEKKISTTDFDITDEECRALAQNGRTAAEKFLKTWDFEIWKALYRE